MIFKRLRSQREIDWPITKYSIDWDRSVSKPQKAVKDFLYPYWKNHPAVCEEFLIPGSLLRIDLLNLHKRIAVEVSPEATHRKFNKHFHRDNKFNFLSTVKRDLDKEEWCKQNKIKFVEVYDEDLDNLSPAWFYTKYKIII